MKKAVASILACASLLLSTGHTASTSTPQAGNPNIHPYESLRSIISVVKNGQPKTGHVYSMYGFRITSYPAIAKASQTIPGGLIIQADYDPSTYRFLGDISPSRFFFETSRKYADNQPVPTGLCGLYTGLYTYTSIFGAQTTIHRFKEVSCTPYLKAEEDRIKKQEEEKSTLPFGQWVEGNPNLPLDGLFASSRVMRLRPDDKAIDLNRWQEAYRKELSGQAALFTFYVDKQTIEKSITSYAVTSPALPPVKYTFWLNGNLKITQGEAKEQYLFEPNRHTVSCDKRTMDNKTVQPESMEEKIYQFFCLSPDAQNTVLELQNRERTEQDKAKLKTTLFQGFSALWGASSLIRGF